MAFEFAESCYLPVHTFSFESRGLLDGKRKFLVTTYHEFWNKYNDMDSSERHYYEVIPESSPCHLYFDLEYKRCYNSTDSMPSDNELVSKFIFFVCDELFRVYDVRCLVSNVLDLVSSTDEKFSRHLIFHLPNVAFVNNRAVGQFVQALAARVNSSSDSTLRSFTVNTENGSRTPFFDLAVYTRNRNFRLFLSSKLGKTAILETSSTNMFRPITQSKYAPVVGPLQATFLASLICNVPFSEQLRLIQSMFSLPIQLSTSGEQQKQM